MRPEERNIPGGSNPKRRRGFELFFYESSGNRYYLRFTRLALVLVVCLTVIPAVAIFAIFFTQSRADLGNVNVNIRQPNVPSNYGGQIIQTTTPPVIPAVPKAGRSPKSVEPI